MASTQVVRPVPWKIPTYKFEMVVALPVDSLWNSYIAGVTPQFITSVEEHVDGELESGKRGVTRILKDGSIAPGVAYVKDEIVTIHEKARTLMKALADVEGGHLAQGFTKFLKSTTVNAVSGSNSKTIIES